MLTGDYGLWVAWGAKAHPYGLLCQVYWQARNASPIRHAGEEYYPPELPNAGGLFTNVLLISKTLVPE